MVKRPEWQLVFVLPNLLLEDHHLSPRELTLGLEGIAIVPASDPRVLEIAEWSEPAARFLNAFHDGNGTTIVPGVLIIRDDWLAELHRDVEPVIAFRNAAAMCCILPARAQTNGGGWLGTPWSNTFDYHSAQLRPDGSSFDLWTPALNSIGFKLDGLSLTCDIRIPRNHVGPIDDHLAVRLGRAWQARYGGKNGRTRHSAKAFRSMEAAYEASALTFRNYSSLQEVGLAAVDWATAVEILAAPKRGNVSKWHCVSLIGQAKPAREPELRHRRYRLKKSGNARRFHSLNLAQWLFINLHHARSKFVHGDRISSTLLLPLGSESRSVLSLASTIYRTALVTFLEQEQPWPETVDDLRSLDLINGLRYPQHLLDAVDAE